MRRTRHKLPLILAVLIIIIIASPIRAESSDIIFEWRPFRANTDLELGLKKNALNNTLIDYPSGLSKVIEKAEASQTSFDNKKATNWNEFNIRYFKIYLSSVTSAPEKGGWSSLYGSKADKLEMIRSLPSMFQNAPSRNTVESLGKIFEPQIKLGIDF